MENINFCNKQRLNKCKKDKKIKKIKKIYLCNAGKQTEHNLNIGTIAVARNLYFVSLYYTLPNLKMSSKSDQIVRLVHTWHKCFELLEAVQIESPARKYFSDVQIWQTFAKTKGLCVFTNKQIKPACKPWILAKLRVDALLVFTPRVIVSFKYEEYIYNFANILMTFPCLKICSCKYETSE